ncbi:MAG: response regulator [Bdellovibrionales bacterium]|nr:response regulator [Bdellovibrionales bacterium]NQZ18851.1 response regulator [Bdellovibrionales bacterium]
MGAAEKALNGKVLVVDDEQELLELITFYLKMNHYEVLAASSAEEALNILEDDIHMIISDICMPSVNGLELYQQIIDKLGYSPKVLFLSGFSYEAEEKAMALGASAVLSKPIDFNKLINYIQLHS